MNRISPFQRCWVATLCLAALIEPPPAAAGTGETELAGLWQSRQILGPAEAGPLLIRKYGDGLLAEFGGYRVKVSTDGLGIAFALPGGGRFEAEMEEDGNIRGHWLQPRSKFDGNVFATPVLLLRGSDSWFGEVIPQPESGTFYLLLRPGEELLAAELINPERNLGIFAGLTRLVRDQDSLTLYGKFRGRGDERVMLQGYYYPEEEVIALRYPGRGGNYDFHRVDSDHAAGFLARLPNTERMISPPPRLDDGWNTASMADAGIDPALIREMIETEILPKPAGTSDLSIHSVLIARDGHLVVEEYFHGYHRDLPHDSRSASKSVTAILAAAVMQAGIDLSWDTPVYSLLEMHDLLEREPERRAITLQHLLNMNTGLDCDDSNPQSAANEDALWDNADTLDFYQHTLNAGVVHAPGEVAVYCSASANLAGGVIATAANRSLLQLIERFVAEPLDIQRYSVPVPPDTHPFMGGGTRWLSRDFLKFPQMILDGGRWNDRHVISRRNAKLLITPVVKINGGRDYGYLWWTIDYPFGGGSVRAHFMGGNGGQIAMLVPDLRLVIVFNAGNYSDRVGFRIQDEIIPKYILPAVKQ